MSQPAAFSALLGAAALGGCAFLAPGTAPEARAAPMLRGASQAAQGASFASAAPSALMGVGMAAAAATVCRTAAVKKKGVKVIHGKEIPLNLFTPEQPDKAKVVPNQEHPQTLTEEVAPAPKPWLQRHLPEEPGASEDLLLNFMQALEERGVQLYEAQEEAVVEIFSGAHVVLDTPTGSGKSLVAVAALFKALAEGGKAYYTSPTKALTSEKFFDLCRHFGPASVGMATGDISLNQRAPLICCTAEVLASIALHEGPASRITAVVMDEFHYFADPDRGSAWELPLWRLTGPGCNTSFLLMSGTLGANDGLYRTLQSRSQRPVRVVSSEDRPVPLHFTYSEASVASSVAELIGSQQFPVYIVHFSQREALRTAREMADAQAVDGRRVLAAALEQDGRQEALRRAVDAASFASPFGAELRELLLKGVGVHHAGLLPRYRRLVEQLSQASLLVLVCGTDTLGVGVNVPIRSVLFTRLCKFDGEDTRLMRSREFHQIAGRAGRKGFDTRGDVVAVDPDWVVHNRELQKLRSKPSGKQTPPRWRRPPRRSYKHWTKKTFQKLQKSRPDPLRSQFRLTMSQVLSVIEGARMRGTDGEAELEDLIESAQCSRGARRFWRRQAKAYLSVLASPSLEQQLPDDGEEVDEVRRSLPADDATLFVCQAMDVFRERVSEEDLPLAALAAAEAVCDAPETLLRAAAEAQPEESTGLRPSQCPEALEDLLFEVFNSFRAYRPWLSSGFLRPKGIALDLVICERSFPALAERLQGAAVTSEGNLLRYLADVYRILRLADLAEPNVRSVQAQLRQTILEVDSSLIREWEALKDMESKAAKEQQEAILAAAAPGAEDEEADEEKLVGGAMVPAARSSAPRRSTEELRSRVQEVKQSLASRHARNEAAERARARSAVGRIRRAASQVWGAVQERFQDLIGVVW